MPAAREKDKSRRKVDEEEIGKYLNNVISGLVHQKVENHLNQILKLCKYHCNGLTQPIVHCCDLGKKK